MQSIHHFRFGPRSICTKNNCRVDHKFEIGFHKRIVNAFVEKFAINTKQWLVNLKQNEKNKIYSRAEVYPSIIIITLTSSTRVVEFR